MIVAAVARHWCREMRVEQGADEIAQPDGFKGHAVTRIERMRDAWWAHNGADATMIVYCPFCGVRLDQG